MARIYTRGGDGGETERAGKRVAKDDALVEALGAIDELSAALGVARAAASDARHRELLAAMQNDLMTIGAELGAPAAGLAITTARVGWLERAIDDIDAELPPLARFILPGGSAAAGSLHLARAVCRRAERRTVSCTATGVVAAPVLAYLNRAADLLFVLARQANALAGVEDEIAGG